MAKILIFSSVTGAEEVAFMLGAEWDGRNAVIIADDIDRVWL